MDAPAVLADAYRSLLVDLASEQEAVDAAVEAAALDRPTVAEGWTVEETVAHLHASDRAALLAVTDPEAFAVQRAAAASASGARAEPPLPGGAALLETWRRTRGALGGALAELEAGTRIGWFGPPMSARSFVTARLMEYWAHGEDIALTEGRALPATGRLRHVCHLGVLTRPFSFRVRGDDAPASQVRVDLEAPDGERWTWGPPDVADRVRGPARHFCLVVTQRRHLGDTELEVRGGDAMAWMARAQVFAGAPTLTAPQRRGLPV